MYKEEVLPVVPGLKLAERALEGLCWRLLHNVHRAEEKGQKLLLPGLDGIRKAGIVTDGPGGLLNRRA